MLSKLGTVRFNFCEFKRCHLDSRIEATRFSLDCGWDCADSGLSRPAPTTGAIGALGRKGYSVEMYVEQTKAAQFEPPLAVGFLVRANNP